MGEKLQFTELDQYLFGQGTHYDVYRKLGAHPVKQGKKEGVYFAVWAPNAQAVSVIGEFNDWNEQAAPMKKAGPIGVFETFVPGAKIGQLYKFFIVGMNGEHIYKADPYANEAELRPGTASRITDIGDYKWKDTTWMKNRQKFDETKDAMAIYEVHPGSWMKHPATEENEKGFFNYRELAVKLAQYVKDMGYTHVELMGIAEHPFDGSWGYQVTGYYAPTSRYGSPEDFAWMINYLHKNKIGVILDWTPAQFPRFDAGLEKFDGTPLYEVQDPAMAVHPMWGTMLYNYGSPMVKDFLISNAFFWLDEFHVDGFRMDDVDAMLYLDFGREAGQWTANLYSSNENLQAMEFLKHLNSIVKKQYPGILLIAQEDGLWPQLTDSVENDHLGFDYKWSGGWTKDLLSYLEAEPLDRRNYYDQLTLSMMYAYSEHYVLTLGKRDVGTLKEFLEKLPGSSRQKDAQLRAAYGYLMLHPGVKMTAPDGDVGPEMRAYLHDLNELYRNHPALYAMDGNSDGFEWIQFTSYDENVVAFLRKTEKPEETILAVCNFSPVSYDSYRVGVPFAGKYKEIFNSDSEKFGGQGVVNARAKAAIHMECDNREFSLKLKLPAYGVAVFGCTPEKGDVKKSSVKKGNVKKTAGKSRGKRMDKAKMTVVEKSVAVKDAVKVVRRVASRRKGASGDE